MTLKRTPAPPEVVVIDNHDYFSTESTFPAKSDPQELWDFLKECSTTGPLTVHFSQGTPNEIRLSEKTKLTDDQANEIRKLLGFDYEVEVD